MNNDFKTSFGDDINAKIASGFNTKTNSKDKPFQTSFGEDINAKIASGFGAKQSKKMYCKNCHREIYASNYTGTYLCLECHKYFYK